MLQLILYVHIAGGLLAIIAGYAALFARKGGAVHRRAGLLFVGAMMAMGAGAAIVGLARDKVTWLGGLVVIYYSLTGLRTMSRSGPPTRADVALTCFGVAIALTSLSMTIRYTLAPTAESLKIPLPLALLSPVLLCLAVKGDLREQRVGPSRGARRVSRHLWRMCYAMLVATTSFFVGQARVIPGPLRIWPLLFVLGFAPLAVMLYSLRRFRHRSASASVTASLAT